MGSLPERPDPRVGFDLVRRAEAALADAARLIAEGRALFAAARRIRDQSCEPNGEGGRRVAGAVTPNGETPVPELRTLTDHIRESPDDRARWVALADWLRARGRDDEAVAVRVLWQTLRDNLSCASLEDTLADVARNAAILAAIAREKHRPADETPPG